MIHTYIEMKNVDGLQQYLKSVFDDLDSLEDYVGGLPPALSVVLGDKTKRARSCGVSLDIQVTESYFGMRDADLNIL